MLRRLDIDKLLQFRSPSDVEWKAFNLGEYLSDGCIVETEHPDRFVFKWDVVLKCGCVLRNRFEMTTSVLEETPLGILVNHQKRRVEAEIEEHRLLHETGMESKIKGITNTIQIPRNEPERTRVIRVERDDK